MPPYFLRLFFIVLRRIAPNSPFLAKKPAFSRRFSFLAVRCFFADTMRPHLFFKRLRFSNPPLVCLAVPWNTSALDPTVCLNSCIIQYLHTFSEQSKIFQTPHFVLNTPPWLLYAIFFSILSKNSGRYTKLPVGL